MRNSGRKIFSTSDRDGRAGTSVECVCGDGYVCRGFWSGSIVPNNFNVDCSCCDRESDETK